MFLPAALHVAVVVSSQACMERQAQESNLFARVRLPAVLFQTAADPES